MTELLPCPFCGGEAELHASYDMDTNEVDGWFAWCNNDRCECKPETNEHFTEAEAIAVWNARAETATLYEDGFYLYDVKFMPERTCRNVDDGFPFFKCSECGCNAVVEYESSGDGLPNYCPNCGAKVVG